MASIEEEDPFRAVSTLREGIADREGRIRRLHTSLTKEQADVQSMRETLGLIIGRNWGDEHTLQRDETKR